MILAYYFQQNANFVLADLHSQRKNSTDISAVSARFSISGCYNKESVTLCILVILNILVNLVSLVKLMILVTLVILVNLVNGHSCKSGDPCES